jgi:hypothetical protein
LNDEFPAFFYKNETNIGRVNNYRKALYEYASGDLAIMLDGDDYFVDNNYLADAVKLFEENKNLVLVFAKIRTLYEADQSMIEDKVNANLKPIFPGNELFINYWKGYSITHQTSLYSRKHAIDLGYYSENIQSTDWESVLRLIQGQKVGFINKYVTVWRKHDSNISRQMADEQIISNVKYIESSYEFAVERAEFDEKKLKTWHLKMLKRYFFRILVQASFYMPEKIEKVWQLMKTHYPELYRSMKFDVKYLMFRILKVFRPLLFFVTKYVLKQESVLKDLELYKARSSKTEEQSNEDF